MGINPYWTIFRKISRVNPQPNSDFLGVVGGASIQMRQRASKIYFNYKLIDSS
jgi:hypothetical protein